MLSGFFAQIGQTSTSTDLLLDKYGLLGLLAWMFIRDIIPWLRARFDKHEDSEAALREAQLTREAAREERSIKAMEGLVNAMNDIRSILTGMNVRLDVIERHVGLPGPEAKEEHSPQPKGKRKEPQ